MNQRQLNSLVESARSFARWRFEDFIIDNKLDFSLTQDPATKSLNNYIDDDTAQIFDVFLQGFRAAVEYRTINKE